MEPGFFTTLKYVHHTRMETKHRKAWLLHHPDSTHCFDQEDAKCQPGPRMSKRPRRGGKGGSCLRRAEVLVVFQLETIRKKYKVVNCFPSMDLLAILLAAATYGKCSQPRGVVTWRPDVPILMVVQEEQTMAHNAENAPCLAFSMVASANLGLMSYYVFTQNPQNPRRKRKLTKQWKLYNKIFAVHKMIWSTCFTAKKQKSGGC